jgi:hypothetical protein
MRIGGNGESWLAVGPVLAVVLVATISLGGAGDMIEVAERFLNQGWDTVVRTLQR